MGKIDVLIIVLNGASVWCMHHSEGENFPNILLNFVTDAFCDKIT